MRVALLCVAATLASAGAAGADPAVATVTRTGSDDGTDKPPVRFPRTGAVRAARIVEEDGGYLDLARSADGRRLWVRRWWDDGSTDVNRFDLAVPSQPAAQPTERLVLQFIDGTLRPVELTWEAWAVDPANKRAFDPHTQQWVPLVPAGPQALTPERLQWMVFAPKCGEAKAACIYYGRPQDVCGRYFDSLSDQSAARLWIAPRRCVRRAP